MERRTFMAILSGVFWGYCPPPRPRSPQGPARRSRSAHCGPRAPAGAGPRDRAPAGHGCGGGAELRLRRYRSDSLTKPAIREQLWGAVRALRHASGERFGSTNVRTVVRTHGCTRREKSPGGCGLLGTWMPVLSWRTSRRWRGGAGVWRLYGNQK